MLSEDVGKLEHFTVGKGNVQKGQIHMAETGLAHRGSERMNDHGFSTRHVADDLSLVERE